MQGLPGLLAGLPDTLNAITVNKVCGSGLQAVMQACTAIRAGEIHAAVAGGMENMDLAPHLMHLRNGVRFGEARMLDHMAHDGLSCAFEKWAMGCAADYTAQKAGISRADQDRFAAQSHQRAAHAKVRHHQIGVVTGDDALGDRARQRLENRVDHGHRIDHPHPHGGRPHHVRRAARAVRPCRSPRMTRTTRTTVMLLAAVAAIGTLNFVVLARRAAPDTPASSGDAVNPPSSVAAPPSGQPSRSKHHRASEACDASC